MAADIILVTGCPRSGTTPVGHMVAVGSGGSTIYEPMGQTGDVRFVERYPLAGEDSFTKAEFEAFLDDLRNVRLKFKSQHRRYYDRLKLSPVQKLIRQVLGTRAINSYRMAQVKRFWSGTVVWKDPNAAFCTRAASECGVPVVVCVRSPEAIAASFKKNGWKFDIAALYERHVEARGAVPQVERALAKYDMSDPVSCSAVLWHLAYQDILAAHAESAKIHFVDPRLLASDEHEAYRKLFAYLGLVPREALWREISSRTFRKKSALSTGVHDWTRSVEATNQAWQTSLSASEVQICKDINSDLWGAVCAAMDESAIAAE